jgi:hypothetical protein
MILIVLALSPSGHGVASIPIWVLYSHTSPVGTAEDLLSQTTKSKYHVIGKGVSGHVIDQVTWSRDLSLSNLVCFLNRKVEFLTP